jgi:hypothetical protein
MTRLLCLLPLLACASPATDTGSAQGEPTVPEPPACLEGHASVQICLEQAARFRVFASNQGEGESLETLMDGPGCFPLYLEPGSWNVWVSTADCGANFDAVLTEACDNQRVDLAPEDFECGMAG